MPTENGPEAALAAGIEVIPVDSLLACRSSRAAAGHRSRPFRCRSRSTPVRAAPDLADLRGQRHLRHALEVAAAGGHSLLMVGPPGAGKSLAASRLPSIMPGLAAEEALEVARIASACGRLGAPRPGGRPFRAPHHTVSPAGLVGGGNPPGPGRGDAGPSRCALPRRALRVPARHARGPAGAAGDRDRLDRAGGLLAAAPLSFHARRRREPLSLRARRGGRGVHLRAAGDPALSGPAERSARGPHRHPRRGPAAGRGRDRGRAGRGLRRGARAGRRGAASDRRRGSGPGAATPR